ncbi:hypothetical protein ACWC0A_18060 [Streptomyces scopuliridis]
MTGTHYGPPGPVFCGHEFRSPTDGRMLPCRHYYYRRYVTGWRCHRHTPSALAGRPEPEPGPGWPPGAYLFQTPDGDEQQ